MRSHAAEFCKEYLRCKVKGRQPYQLLSAFEPMDHQKPTEGLTSPYHIEEQRMRRSEKAIQRLSKGRRLGNFFCVEVRNKLPSQNIPTPYKLIDVVLKMVIEHFQGKRQEFRGIASLSVRNSLEVMDVVGRERRKRTHQTGATNAWFCEGMRLWPSEWLAVIPDSNKD